MRAHLTARAVVLCTAVVVLASTAGLSTAAAQQAQPTAQAVPGMRYLADIWCAADGTCLGVGHTPENVGAVVVLRANGSIGPVRPVPGTQHLSGIDCPPGGSCIAVGGGFVNVVEVSRDGTPGPARPAPGTSALGDVACPTATTCLATGALLTPPPEPDFSITTYVYTVITNGQPQPAREFPRGTRRAFGIDCPTTTRCLVLARDAVVVLNDAGGTWLATLRRISPDSGAGYPTQAISCASSTTCYATASGSIQTPEGSYGVPAIVPVTVDGLTGPVQILTDQRGLLDDISCVFGRTCTVVGHEHTTSRGLSIDVFRGTPGPPVVWGNSNLFTGVSCIAPGTCGIVGYLHPNGTFAWHGPVPA